MTKVINVNTYQELHYSLPIKEALVAANEQEKGNWNTWTYNKRHRKTRCFSYGI